MKGLHYLDWQLGRFFNSFVRFFSDMNNFRAIRRFFMQVCSMSPEGAFTLIELVMVIAIIGILASLAVPKFLDLSGSAKQSATKAGLGSLRSVLAIRYAASATGGVTASYPTQLAASDFAGAEVPKNALNTFSGVTGVTETTTGLTTNASAGFWYVSGPTNAANYGKAGAYSDGSTNTSGY